MSGKNNIAFVIGNGRSRESFDLNRLTGNGLVVGCNALYREYYPDILVGLDDGIVEEIRGSDYPQDQFFVPEEVDKYEPAELWNGAAIRPKSNAGMIALEQAIKTGAEKIYILGFDFLLPEDEFALSNVYENTANYGSETRCSLADARRRIRFFEWFTQKYSYVEFVIVIPDDCEGVLAASNHPNYFPRTYTSFSKEL